MLGISDSHLLADEVIRISRSKLEGGFEWPEMIKDGVPMDIDQLEI